MPGGGLYGTRKYARRHKGSTETLALHSRDQGRTWTRYRGNPVLDLHMTDFRDPSVSWDEMADHWVMAVSLPKEHKVRFYSSPNLIAWTQLSDFGPARPCNWRLAWSLAAGAGRERKGKNPWALKR